ncbi:MAG: diaminopimelate epimerase [Bacteroidota bacterium]
MNIQFFKYQGTGNDFIIINNLSNEVSELTTKQVNFLCDRRFGIGADGLMLLSKKEGYDFEMIYYNADGNESSMCGNGGRCLVKFAQHQGINKIDYHFIAIDGDHEAKIDNAGIVSLKMKNVDTVSAHNSHAVLNTGSPHYVKFSSNVEDLDVVEEGRHVRYSKEFITQGINVNFVETIDDGTIYVRTYERGVENETLSCGTGVTAAALVSAHNDKGFNEVKVKTPGGSLSVEFTKIDDSHFEDIWLSGPAEFVYSGEIEI